MLSRLNVASWGLLVGAFGQCVFYGNLFPRIPLWAVLVPLLPPWLAVYTISFCRHPPCGPRQFRHCLIFAMSWYAATALAGEVLTDVLHPVLRGHLSLTLGRALTLLGGLTFVVFAHACFQIRQYEMKAPVITEDKV